ncbi:MAG: HDOD domain-containing protein [Acidobacteriota bacterium]
MAVEASELSGFIESLEELPTLPAVAIRLIEITTDNGTGLREVVRMIETDHAISAKVLKIANSAYYSRQGKVSTVGRAAVLLGKDTIRSVVLTAVVFDCFRPESNPSFDLVKFWSHCAACAIASEVIARRLKYPRPMDAFVAGLLHDMGKLVLACWNSQAYGQAVEEARQSGSRLLEIEEKRFGIGHTALAKLTMEKWRFPSDLIESAWLHHQPLSSFGEDPRRRLPFLVKAANSL